MDKTFVPAPNANIQTTEPQSTQVEFQKGGADTFAGQIRYTFDWRKKSGMDQVKDQMNEHSPLMGPRSSADADDGLSPIGTPKQIDYDELEAKSQETKSSWYLFLLTFALGG